MLFNFLYCSVIRLYVLTAFLMQFFSPKAAKWINGQRIVWKSLAADLPEKTKGKRIWIHCASLGEFEQGRPMIEMAKQNMDGVQIILTFFSPSGYEVRKNFPLADRVFYLPADTTENASRFINLIQPDIAVFVKYEIWWNYLNELKKQQIPALLISAVFRPQQFYFRWYGMGYRRALTFFWMIFVQNESSRLLLNQFGIHQTKVAPDSRFDRVWSIAQEKKSLYLPELFAGTGQTIMVCGSTWPKDETLLAKAMKLLPDNLSLIIAPHETDNSRIESLEDCFQNLNPIRYSQALENQTFLNNPKQFRVLILDNMGMLATVYRYGQLAYIGGGFGAGIHNILEAVVYGVPVFFGPRFSKFNEAVTLVQLGGAFSAGNPETLADNILKGYPGTKAYQHVMAVCNRYIKENIGGTALVYQELIRLLNKSDY